MWGNEKKCVINYVRNCVRKCVRNCEVTWEELSEDLRGTNCRNSVNICEELCE